MGMQTARMLAVLCLGVVSGMRHSSGDDECFTGLFKLMDKEPADGSIDYKEFWGNGWATLDADHDGSLEKKEFQKAVPSCSDGTLESIIGGYDTDGNSKMEANEWYQVWKHVDSDPKDGSISETEWKGKLVKP